MRKILTMALFAGAMSLPAQYAGRPYRESRERVPLDRVRGDLERAAADLYYISRGEVSRINHARDEIGEFQAKWERGRFDRGELNDVIGSLQHVVDKNRLQPRDRDRLLDDLARLREFRAGGGRGPE